MTLLRFENVSKHYEGKAGAVTVRAMVDVSFTLAAGQFVAVRGPSGCGKSTLLLAAGALLRPTTGTVTLDGENVYALDPEARAKLRAAKIGFVFQQFHLVPYLSVFDNVMAAALATSDGRAEGRARELLERFHLTPRAGHTPGELSTGERQRCALARALLNQPKLLLADEPTGNLDADNATIVLNTLSAFASTGGAVLLVTHDDRAAAAAHSVTRMDAGRIAAVAAAAT